MIIEKYMDANDFLNETQEFLEQDEVSNNVILGTCLRLRKEKNKSLNESYFAAIKEDENILLVAMITPPFPIAIYSDNINCDDELSLLIEDLLNNNIEVNGVIAPIELANSFSLKWCELKACNKIDGLNMRAYELVDVNHPRYSKGNLRDAKDEDLETISRWIYNLEKDDGSDITCEQAYEMAKNKITNGELYVWEDKIPVSMACATRPTTNGIVVNMVYTPSELRQKGYASSCVAALSQHLLDKGYKFCSLFTDLSNPTSNSIYIKIGYKAVCDYKSYSFKE